MKAFNLFDAIFVINLAESADRLERITRRMKAMGCQFYRFNAVALPSDSPSKRPIQLRACALSHLRAIRRAQTAGIDNVLIIEDDAIFRDDTPDILKSLADDLNRHDWDLLYLGGDIEYRGRLTPRLWTVADCYQTHAYAVNASGYAIAAEWLEDCIAGDISPFDAWRCPLRKLAVAPLLAIQEPGISTIENQPVNKLDKYFRTPEQLKEFKAHCAELAAMETENLIGELK